MEAGQRSALDILQAEADGCRADLGALVAEVEAGLAQRGSAWLPEVLAEHRPAMAAAMDRLGAAVAAFLAAEPTDVEMALSHERLAAPLIAWWSSSPAFQRGLHKPPDSGADPEIAALVLDGRPAGADAAALLFNDYIMHSVTTRAYRNRLSALVRCVQEATVRCAERGIAPVHILSLFSDSGVELPLLARDPRLVATAHITCVDARTEALRGARRLLSPEMLHRTRLMRADPVGFPFNPLRPPWRYDIIYSLSLAPHLSDAQATRLIRGCHEVLVSGGMLVLGSSTPGIPAGERALDAWLIRWNQHYRDDADWRRLFADTPFGAGAVRVEPEALGANALVSARRE